MRLASSLSASLQLASPTTFRMGPDLVDCQLGFREGRFTVDAVLRLKSLTDASVRRGGRWRCLLTSSTLLTPFPGMHKVGPEPSWDSALFAQNPRRLFSRQRVSVCWPDHRTKEKCIVGFRRVSFRFPAVEPRIQRDDPGRYAQRFGCHLLRGHLCRGFWCGLEEDESAGRDWH